MNIQALASHYSQALFKLASSKEQLKKHLSELEEVFALFEANPQLEQVLLAPSIDNQKKKKVLQDLLSDKVDNQLLHFLLLLIDKERFEYLSEIYTKYRRLTKQALDILVVQLITAVPVDLKVKEKLQNKLENIYRKSIEIKESVDSSIIGGMILIMNNQMIDNSIRRRLNDLNQSLLEAII